MYLKNLYKYIVSISSSSKNFILIVWPIEIDCFEIDVFCIDIKENNNNLKVFCINLKTKFSAYKELKTKCILYCKAYLKKRLMFEKATFQSFKPAHLIHFCKIFALLFVL